MLQFLLGGNLTSRKMAWVSWYNMCRPKEKGGLGFSCNSDINSVALAKLYWNLENKSSIAAKIIHEKYVKNKQSPTTFSLGSHIWKSIGKRWELYHHSLACVVGDGVRLIFERKMTLVGPLNRGQDQILAREVGNVSSVQIQNFLGFPVPIALCEKIASIPSPINLIDYSQIGSVEVSFIPPWLEVS